MIGLHIISDLKNINFDRLKIDESTLKDLISDALKTVGLIELGNYYHTFNNNNEITCIIALAESHLSIHTWPEKKYVSLDIFVCNMGFNNSEKARQLYKILLDYFNTDDIEDLFIERKSK